MAEEDCKRYVVVNGSTWEDVDSNDDLEATEHRAEALNKQQPDIGYFVRDREERKRIQKSPAKIGEQTGGLGS
jgi:hypothetical protein